MPGRAFAAALAFVAVGADARASETGFYVGADAAWVAPTVGKSDGANFISFDGVTHVDPESVHYDDSALGWSAMIGYRIHRNLAAEFAYADFGSIDVQEVYELPDLVPGGPGSGRFIQEFSTRVSGPMLSVLGILPVSEGFEAYARAGVLWASQEVEMAPSFSITDAEEQWLLGIGMQAELGRAWSARLEYQRFDEIPATFMSGEVDYERVLAGVTYRLGPREAPATDREPLTEGTQRGFYAVADFGVTDSTVGKSDGFLIAIVPFPGIIFRVLPESANASGSEPGFGATLGYRINRYLAAELAYTDFGSVDIAEEYLIRLPFPFPPNEPRREVINLTAEVAGPSINVLGKLPVGEGFELFLRGGLLFADQDVTRWSGDFTRTSSNADELWVIGGGVDVRFSDRWSARFAYESVDRLGKTEFSGPMRLERFVFGASYDF